MSVPPDGSIGVGLYGLNAHQVHEKLRDHDRARLVGVTPSDGWPDWLHQRTDIKHYPGLDAMLDDPDIQLVSLCSPMRSEQAREALRCIESGRHVYAEKPCAFTEAELDQLVHAAEANKIVFREMNDTLYTPPFFGMRRRVLEGAVGQVVQVLTQKS